MAVHYYHYYKVLHKYSSSFGFKTDGSMDATVKPAGMTDICSCNICTSYIRVGRIYGVLRRQMTMNTYATINCFIPAVSCFLNVDK